MAVVLMSGDPAQIVRFWQAVEIFSPQQLPREEGRGNVADFRPGQAMPWEQGAPLRELDHGKVWRHEVFCGVFRLSKVRDVLVERFDQDNPESVVRGESALFACTIDADGFLVEQSAVLSSCAWAIGQILRGRSPLTSFPQDALRYADDLGQLAGSPVKAGFRLLTASLLNAAPDAVSGGVTAAVTSLLAALGGPLAAAGGAMAGSVAGRIAKSVTDKKSPDPGRSTSSQPRLKLSALTGDDLQRFSSGLADDLGVTNALRPRNVRVRSYQISSTRADEETEQSFLNSFYADDLARVARELGRGNAGTALGQYLTSTDRINTADRVDVRKDPLIMRSGCAPDRIPAGRWVTNSDSPLTFSQQFAVNQAMRDLAGHPGLFAVNGPPGTGKTTMLRDIIAAIIVQRAIELACLDTPAEAFHGEPRRWQTEKTTHRIKPPNPALTGFEIVVASSNNGAVENVTNEIPGQKGIGDQWRNVATGLDYFTKAAERLYGRNAWAMIAARLGNYKNRRAFVQGFWRDSLRDTLLRPAANPLEWDNAVRNFRRALARVSHLSAQRTEVSRSVGRLQVGERECARATARLAAATTERERLVARQPALEQEMRHADDVWQAAEAAVRAHRPGKPGWFAFLSRRNRAARQDWEGAHAELGARFLNADRRRATALRAAHDLRVTLSTALSAEDDAQATVSRLNDELRAARDLVDDARQRWHDHVPCGPEYADTAETELIERREKSTPWADEEFTAARTEAFLAALDLHKALIKAEAPTIRENLDALMDILAGNGHPDDAVTIAAWQTFFLVVPVVSSTFASFAPLFRGFGRESLGWLLIDEAGQAAPQYAAGALWRSRRAVIVGDPRQLEPVVTMPWAGQQALLHAFGVGEEWAPSRTSAQQAADRLARYGTSMPGVASNDPIWVGAPLRVHRRCDQPMFDISNTIAYDGLMVFGKPEGKPFHGHSVWCDIRSSVSEGHWIPAEGKTLHLVLTRLREAALPVGEIRVISPFRQVVSGAMRIHQAVFPETAAGDRKKWVGTVHTMQGKEADVVILILGGNPDRPGSRQFATDTPNLLNVAVTRARRRLYVIGNQETWGREQYFGELANRIPVWEP